MNKKKRIATIIVAMAMFCMMSMSALAATTQRVVLGSDQVWTVRYPVTRTGAYSEVYAKCDSVYPGYGIDTYTKIQARIVNSSGTLIMKDSKKDLTEGHDYTAFKIEEGHLNDEVSFQFRGNNNNAAYANVSYYSN